MTITREQPSPSSAAPYPPQALAWWAIIVLFLVTLFSQLDRQLPALLVGPIKAEFQISDTGFSYLQGMAFALIYTLAGLPFGRLVDRTNRRNLIVIGLVIWSLTTALAAFAQEYWHFFACRMGVGVGEAFLAPAAYSIIADYVPPKNRARALGFYYLSLAIGGGASLLVGGMILRQVPPEGLHGFEPWRLMFLIAGLPGLLLVFLLATVREPARRETAKSADANSIGAFVRHLGAHRWSFLAIYGNTTLNAIIGYAALGWAPALLVRRHGLDPADAGMIVGLSLMVAGIIGSIGGSFLSDRWTTQALSAARLRVVVIGFLISTPGLLLWPLAPNAAMAGLLLGVTLIGTTFSQSAAPAVIQDIVPNAMRGQAIAVYLLFAGLLGIGLGPTFVALATDNIFRSEAALPQALVVICVPLSIIALLISFLGLKPYARTRAEVMQMIGE